MSEAWIEIAKAIGTGLGIAIPLIGIMMFFHTKRGERFDHLDATNRGLQSQISQLDTDVDGLVRQLGGIVADVERRFVGKDEHTAAVNRLETSMRGLDRTIGELNGHLFELARSHNHGAPP